MAFGGGFGGFGGTSGFLDQLNGFREGENPLSTLELLRRRLPGGGGGGLDQATIQAIRNQSQNNFGRGFPVGSRPGFRQENRLGDPDVATIQAKLRAQAAAGNPLRLPKELIGFQEQFGTTPAVPRPGLPNLGVPAGFGSPFQGARSPQDQFLKPFQKLRSQGALPGAAQGLNSTDVLNFFSGGGLPPTGGVPFGPPQGQGILDKIGSKFRSIEGLNTGIGLPGQQARNAFLGQNPLGNRLRQGLSANFGGQNLLGGNRSQLGQAFRQPALQRIQGFGGGFGF